MIVWVVESGGIEDKVVAGVFDSMEAVFASYPDETFTRHDLTLDDGEPFTVWESPNLTVNDHPVQSR